jgi:dihydrofolate synthase/folylpolyglutamate synthase
MIQKTESYNDSVNYLYNLRTGGIKLGLTNTRSLLNILDNPQDIFNSVHIAGTNGKGSTAATIAYILKESGFKVGLYTSPHLISFTERIRVDGQNISEEDVIKLTSYIRKSVSGSGIMPTFFEFITAMAFYYFASKEIEWAVIETGMGGSYDATNVIKPDISVITDVSIDHTEFLGKTLSDITIEKAGIIKPHVPVVTAARSPEAFMLLSDIANSNSSEIHIHDRDFKGSLVSMNDNQIVFDYSGFRDYHGLRSPLTGRHQVLNSSMAVRVCEILGRSGVTITEKSIRQGVINVRLEGRLEKVSDRPHIIVDAAHNPVAAKALAKTIKELFADRKIILVIGIMKDKDIRGILSPLIDCAATIILTVPGDERAETPEELHRIILDLRSSIKDHSQASILESGSVSEAIAVAKEEWSEDSTILVTGSFHTTGEAKEALGHTGILPELRE